MGSGEGAFSIAKDLIDSKDPKPYMQKTCDVAEMAILAKKNAEKVRKSRQNVNRDKSA